MGVQAPTRACRMHRAAADTVASVIDQLLGRFNKRLSVVGPFAAAAEHGSLSGGGGGGGGRPSIFLAGVAESMGLEAGGALNSRDFLFKVAGVRVCGP